MRFSVLLAVYGKENPIYFDQAIYSIVNQQAMPAEIVIVKDGPLTEALENICGKYAYMYEGLFKFIQLKCNKGLGTALQVGVQYCSNDIVARMDSDDISKTDRFLKQIEMLKQNSELAIIGSAVEEFSITPDHIDAIRAVPLTCQDIRRYAKKRNPFNHMSVMFRKSAVLAVGNYQPFPLNEDYYLWFRIILKGYQVENLQECLVSVRADRNMYQRRGGMRYFLQEIKLQSIFYQSGFVSFFEYLQNLMIRFSIRIIPNILRGYFYRKYLRKKISREN